MRKLTIDNGKEQLEFTLRYTTRRLMQIEDEIGDVGVSLFNLPENKISINIMSIFLRCGLGMTKNEFDETFGDIDGGEFVRLLNEAVDEFAAEMERATPAEKRGESKK